MKEAFRVLERLARIDALRARGAPTGEIVAELQALVPEAEAWARREGGDAGSDAVDELRAALARDMIAV
jgi:hypothetical protein